MIRVVMAKRDKPAYKRITHKRVTVAMEISSSKILTITVPARTRRTGRTKREHRRTKNDDKSRRQQTLITAYFRTRAKRKLKTTIEEQKENTDARKTTTSQDA